MPDPWDVDIDEPAPPATKAPAAVQPKPQAPRPAPPVKDPPKPLPRSQLAEHLDEAPVGDPEDAMVEEVPPWDERAERGVLGCMLVEDWAADMGLATIRREQFYSDVHRAVFDCIRLIRERREHADPINAAYEMRRRHPTLRSEFEDLHKAVMGIANAGRLTDYAKIVRKCWHDREIRRLIYEAHVSHGKVEKVDELRQVCVARESEDMPPVKTSLQLAQEALDRLAEPRKEAVYTGIRSLDALMLGTEPGEVVTVAARTSQGKTATLAKIAKNVARAGLPVCYFGGEMDEIAIFLRMLGPEAGVLGSRLRTRTLEPEDWKRLTAGAATLSELPLSICGIPNPTLQEIESVSFKVGAKVIFVDYLQRCKLPRREEFRHSVGDFMKGLKNMTRFRNLRTFLGCQMGRQLDRENRPPALADLSESKTIEEESDTVVLLWPPDEEAFKTQRVVRMVGILAKGRGTGLGMATLEFDRWTVDMRDASPDGANDDMPGLASVLARRGKIRRPPKADH